MYERRLLAYIDILGWREIIRKSAIENALFEEMKTVAARFTYELDATRHLRDWHANLLKEHPGKIGPMEFLDVTHFSDTVVMSCPSQGRLGGSSLIQAVQITAMTMLDAGYYTRGAVVEGQLFHNGSTIFGPALIEAYDLERGVAKYPRILVTEQALPFVNPPVHTPDGIEYFRQVRLDRDGLHYVDILGAFCADTSTPRFRKGNEEKAIAACKGLRDRDAADLGLRAKHEWMIDYLESVWRESVDFPAVEHPVA